MGVLRDLKNKRFGKLFVIERSTNDVRNKPRWLCQCDCGRKTIAGSDDLTQGKKTTCGDYSHRIKYNKYDLSGEHGIGYTNKGKEFYFDLEDYDKIKDYTWNMDGYGYAITTTELKKDKNVIKMHRLLTDFKYGQVDHVNRVRHDNRKENLRFSTQNENARNGTISIKNKSGFIGVYEVKNKIKNTWMAYIMVNKKNIYLGRFKTKEEAIIARLKAEKIYHMEFAPQRHLFEEYGIK